MEIGKKSGHIPAFGNWDYANDLPITKYFECARQAGLIPPSSSSSSPSLCQCGPCVKARYGYPTDVYTNTNHVTDTSDFKKARIRVVAVTPIIKQRQRQRPRPTSPEYMNVKPVDEDLYKIPSNILHNSSKKKMLGFFFRCLVPPCAA